jgi:hypothetical protein
MAVTKDKSSVARASLEGAEESKRQALARTDKRSYDLRTKLSLGLDLYTFSLLNIRKTYNYYPRVLNLESYNYYTAN